MHSTLFSPTCVVFLAFTLVVVATPINTICDPFGSVNAADFNLDNNLWGESSASSGSQCTYLDYDSGDSISWQTSWTWEGDGSGVKSYANAGLNMGATPLSSITSMQSSWSWSYTGTSIVADVSYDAFISSVDSTSAAHDYEVMIWLAALGGAEPIGHGNPIASPSIDGVAWNLYKGTNTWTVFSFVASSEQTEFSGNILNFFTYLIDNEGLPSDYYLQTIQAGTEAFTGSNAWFTVSPYKLSMDT
ncbi:glycoside hydrolase family 12 protein [Oidiodendron maius Zn]|uniref:Glycoside hydrolase family 12 protein n=1 Tax=Oidiodendron maius (strain Zn) TaxID=913774 RepID=A0A0C3G8H7_OIDMZ|nr:glycoside hydrolase family 12 protein [Oidiodendron maius Zn]